MKIYINTENQPPVLSTTLSTKTDEEGVLRVYSQGSSGTVSELIFKRGTTVNFDVVVCGNDIDDNTVAALRFGVKLKGKYDDVLVVSAEASGPGEAVELGRQFSLSCTFDSAVIDTALAVNSDASDDIESASFIAEIAWENTAGEVTATKTVSATIVNNVLRLGDADAGAATSGISASWSALMVVRLPYAEYLALCEADEDIEDVLYVCPDAPSTTAELEARVTTLEENQVSTEYFEENLAEINTSCATQMSSMLAQLEDATSVATTSKLGTVKIGSNTVYYDSECEFVTLDANSFMVVHMATNDDLGVIKLGTETLITDGINVGIRSGKHACVSSADVVSAVQTSLNDGTLDLSGTALATSVSDLTGDVEALTTKLTALADQVSALSEKYTTLADVVTELAQDFAELKTTVDNLVDVVKGMNEDDDETDTDESSGDQ